MHKRPAEGCHQEADNGSAGCNRSTMLRDAAVVVGDSCGFVGVQSRCAGDRHLPGWTVRRMFRDDKWVGLVLDTEMIRGAVRIFRESRLEGKASWCLPSLERLVACFLGMVGDRSAA